MATKVTPNESEIDEWETINVGLGREWDLEQDGPLVGHFIGSGSKTVPDPNNQGGTRDTAYYQFDIDGETRFIWGSYNIDLGMTEFSLGDKARITFLGIDNFKGDKGPQQIKNYKFERRAAK